MTSKLANAVPDVNYDCSHTKATDSVHSTLELLQSKTYMLITKLLYDIIPDHY